jgi:hypothetical protein
MITKLRDQHDVIRTIAAELRGLLAAATPDMNALTDCRWRMVRTLLQHLALEERWLYRPLERDTRSDVVTIAATTRQELDGAFAQLQVHIDGWPAKRVEANWSEYVRATGPFIDLLLDRMEHEERELFPLVDGKADIGVRTPADRNWAADAMALRDKIEAGAAPARQRASH